MKTYRLMNDKLNDWIEFEAKDDEQAKAIALSAIASRGWDKEDCACCADLSSYDDYKWDDANG